MGYRIYGEPEERESPITSFFIGIFLGAVGIYDCGAWVAVSFGWITQTNMRLVCLGIGILIGLKLAFSAWRSNQLHNRESYEKNIDQRV